MITRTRCRTTMTTVTTTTRAVAKKAGVTAKRLPAGKARGDKPVAKRAPATVEAKAA